MPSPVVTARVDHDTFASLDLEAQRRGVTRTDLVREAIALVLAGDSPSEAQD